MRKMYRARKAATNRNRTFRQGRMKRSEVWSYGVLTQFRRPWQCKPTRQCKTKEKDGGGEMMKAMDDHMERAIKTLRTIN